MSKSKPYGDGGTNPYSETDEARALREKTECQRQLTVAIQAILADEKGIYEALDYAIPVPIGAKDRFKYLRDFSTGPKGLALSPEEFERVWNIPGEWLARFRAWIKSRRPPKGKPGRPRKNEIYRAWIKLGRPAVTPTVLGKVAHGSLRSEWEKATTESARHKLRERVRTAIRRGEGNPAT